MRGKNLTHLAQTKQEYEGKKESKKGKRKERKKKDKERNKKERKNVVSYRLNLLCILCLPLPHITTHLWPQPMGDNAWLTLGPSLSDVNLVFLCWPPRSQEKTTVKWHSRRLPITALSLTLPMCKHTMERQTQSEVARWRDREGETDRQTERQKDLLAYLGLFLFVSTHQTVGWKWQTSNRNRDMIPLVKPLFSTRPVDFWKLS